MKPAETKRPAARPAAWCILLVYLWAYVLFPAHAGAQSSDATTACVDAEAMATARHSSVAWFAIGCLLGGTGLLIALVADSQPPAVTLLGKSPEYAAAFTDCYRKKAQDIRVHGTLGGCLIAAAFWTVFLTAYFVFVVGSAETE